MTDDKTTGPAGMPAEVFDGGFSRFLEDVGKPACDPRDAEIARLQWLPAPNERDGDPWNSGWNRCLEYICDYRAGIKPGTGEDDLGSITTTE